jgi:hypothetical protein
MLASLALAAWGAFSAIPNVRLVEQKLIRMINELSA